jgi:hypothetical protein
MFGRTVWGEVCCERWVHCRSAGSAADLSSLLKVMVMLDDAPHNSIAKLSPQHADICMRGRQFRAQLPCYLEQQRATVVTH